MITKAINDIIDNGKDAGACELLKDGMSLNALASLLFTPQGIEFCQKENFPYHADLRALSKDFPELHHRGIFIDYGTISTSRRKVFASGQTIVECTCKHPKYIYNIVLAHGAHAIVKASDFAVVNVYSVGDGCTFEIEADESSVVFDKTK